MGRVTRQRRRRMRRLAKVCAVDDFAIIKFLEDWMSTFNWKPTIPLVPCIFPNTGRGLMCLEDVNCGDSLVAIPGELIVTTSTVYESEIIKLFKNRDLEYECQGVLATFLVYEKHLREYSKWNLYINSLPRTYSNPHFCTAEEKRLMTFISNDLDCLAAKVCRNFYAVLRSLGELKRSGNDLCTHCGKPLSDILTFHNFMWAYYTVNTRAIYIDEWRHDNNSNERINLSDEDNLALAPFLDLFNHSYDAETRVNIVCDIKKNGRKASYSLQTIKSFKKGSQIFINYGSHNSRKLFLEYGFFMPNNPLDYVPFCFDHLKKFVQVSAAWQNYITEHKMDREMGFTANGLNYNGRSVLFLLTTKLQKDQWQFRIFDRNFSLEDYEAVNNVARKICGILIFDYTEQLNEMKLVANPTEGFKIAKNLVQEYIDLLKNSLEKLDSNLDLKLD